MDASPFKPTREYASDASRDITMVDEHLDGDDSFMEDGYGPEEIATRIMLMEPSLEEDDDDSDVDADYNPMEDEDMDDDDDTSSSGEFEEFNPEIEIQLPSKTPMPPIDYEGIMKAYAAGNHDNEEEAEFSGSDGDDSSSSSSDELDEKHDPDAVSTAVLLQEPGVDDEDEDEDVDDRGFLPRKVQVGVVVGNSNILGAQIDQITENTERM